VYRLSSHVEDQFAVSVFFPRPQTFIVEPSIPQQPGANHEQEAGRYALAQENPTLLRGVKNGSSRITAY
jgi:hypothetical protein